jgi:hypothetical protein
MGLIELKQVFVAVGLDDQSSARVASLMWSSGSDWVKEHTAIPAKWVAEHLRSAGVCDDCDPVAKQAIVDCLKAGRWKPSDLYPAPPTSGPGTELSKLLKRFGINPTPTCQCRAKAAEMNAWGCDEASKPERIEEVVAVMRAEATARGLPFLDLAGRLLVRRAIANARRNA